MDMKSWKRSFRRVPGREAYMTMAYNRSQSVLPLQLQHSVPSGHPSPFNYSQTFGNTASYGHFRPPWRGRGHRMSRGSSRFTNRNNMVGPRMPLYPDPGKRYYQSYDNFSSVSHSYSQSHQQLQYLRQANPYVPWTEEEPQALEETVTFSETEEGDEAAFPAVPVVEKSAEISAASCVSNAPATVFSSSVATSTEDNVTTPIPPQTEVQPLLESPSAGRPVVIPAVSYPYHPAPSPTVSEVGDSGSIALSYSYDPNGSDLPQDTRVVQYYFNLGLQYYYQSYWHSMWYRQQTPLSPPAEADSADTEPAPLVEQSVAQLHIDVGRDGVQQVLPETGNGTFQNVEPPPQSYGSVCYPVVTDPYGQSPPPGFDYRISLVPAYHYVSTRHHVNPSYGNPSQFLDTGNPRQMHQVSYITSPSPRFRYGPPDI